MSAARATVAPAPRPSTRQIFELRCECRAYLFAIGEYALQEAVDQLQVDAEASGLVAEIGQNAVQAIMSAAFSAVRDSEITEWVADDPPATGISAAEAAWSAEGWREAAREYHQARGTRITVAEPHELPPDWDAMSLGALWGTLNDARSHDVAECTLLAAKYLIATGDKQRLRQWLDSRTAEERKAILKHLENPVAGAANE